ncbi:MAG: efflux RND transporter permease subunit [Candidatus Abyssobacteria bacterium SURF_5]|uniref:Efflux RND transporter permease subunit n=1 Tax=Abyssobacteria bacterium (strain SURF_5) TaxID=2093360 RepID=A0A3A4NN79_ABYX5|nr:MAG: efflux RND transporter permease subunit [Candidatus Abyssubacteria bacterium SURF_5]
MFLPEVSIRRPVLAAVMTTVLIVFGIIGLMRLPVRELPDVDWPIVNINVTYPGASPEIVETEVTDKIEEVVNTVEGIKTLRSVSAEGGASITAEFELERDIDVAAQDVRDKVSAIRRDLPDEIDEPRIQKFDIDAQAIMWIAVTHPEKSRIEINDFTENVLKDRLEKLKGIGEITIGGQTRFAVRLWLDAERLAAYDITINDVARALRSENVEIPSGRIEGQLREYVIKTEGQFKSVGAFNDLIVAYRGGAPVRLRDVGEATPGPESYRALARFNGIPSIGLGIVKQSQANTVAVADAVKAELDKLRPDLPPGYEVTVAFDASEYVRESVDQAKESLIQGAILASLVVFVFLGSVRGSIIVAIAIPTSILAAFGVMYFLDFTLNNLTLLGLVIAVGVIVDDAIVVVENTSRHISLGKGPVQASLTGTNEVAFAAIATTLALDAVFIPVAFVTGLIGRFFFEFGLTVFISVSFSTFIALSLTPMLNSQFFSARKEEGFLLKTVDSWERRMREGYRSALRVCLRHRALMVAVGLASVIISVFFFLSLGTEMTPPEDRGSIIIFMKGPQGATVQYTDKYLREVEAILQETPEVRTFFTAIGMSRTVSKVNEAMSFVRLHPLRERQAKGQRRQQEVMADLRSKLNQIPGFLVFLTEPSPIQQGRNKPVQFVLLNPDIDALREGAENMMADMNQVPGLVDVDSDLEINKPKLRVEVDRNRAADMGISIADAAQAMRVLLGGDDITDFKEGGESYEVVVQFKAADREVPKHIDDIYVRNVKGELIRLSSILNFEETVGPAEINRFNRQRSVTLTANTENLPLGEALEKINAISERRLTGEFSTALAGTSETMMESFTALLMALLLSVVFTYLVLAAQFNSFVHPFTILLALPLAFIGSFGALLLAGMTFNIFSFIGIIVLVGIATKNSILLVEFINQRRRQGMPRREAVIEASGIRLRPILMTAISTIGGVLPIALGLGAGAESRRPMGVATAGGLISSTLLTLFIVPVAYSLIDDFGQRFVKLLEKLHLKPVHASEEDERLRPGPEPASPRPPSAVG